VIHKRAAARRRNLIARPDTAEVASGDAVPCANPACRAGAWPLVAKPRKWPWAEHCRNCHVELRCANDRQLVI
jgi:hypothetical protein